MAENQSSSPPSDDSEWQSLVDDVEHRFVALSTALADLRGAVTRLTAHKPALAATSNGWGAPQPEEPEVATAELVAAFEEAATAFEGALNEEAVEQPAAVEEPEAVPEPVASVEQPAVAAPDKDEEAKRREEVGRMVAQAKQELNAQSSISEGSWPVTKPAEANEVDSTSEGSWPVTKPGEANAVDSTSEGSWPMAGGPVKSHTFPHSEPTKVEDEKVVEDVVAEAESVVEAAEQDDEARREEVARMVAEMRAGLVPGEAAQPEGRPAAAENAEPKRDVAKMIADIRATMSNTDDPQDQAVEDEGDVPPDESFAGAAAATAGEKPPADDAEVRDEVRRAVEAAKAEMAAGWVKSAPDAGAATAGESKFSFPDWQNTRIEPSGPPVIVIKDTEGRVELARVYETLSQVKCDENAALLNYTPHSVTVGLNARAQIPTKEALEAAVRVVFGRKCRVESDGVRLSVDIGKDLGKEDAA